ncbi:high affinity cAMP-specific and IBMX-insensitive 3',5'-cyclic phosphodiesterase 8A-like isoform X1 [Daphnia pulicaria]|uniref:high affinity cAMP-specific and IBMX-insensitive 3',5'-cyclic phosphodiesterase 8A-like isoform X1 n=1 Tax=Daphnia pulicaria TaxID=35523 RepID=UPI001EEB8F81|nr:high affinity cAMP-specific and IBMX-insensitive 3',5'-cyclic phosphodiesterase 8A-like isoform X1 [Daphnia pulicaria]XP_046643617.1 high affinity cAMP-specific and IBMX-insensitive 3',5'-cyclic phosphodiesterase 8A-like isoform X1 [Daphnia pulicaria]
MGCATSQLPLGGGSHRQRRHSSSVNSSPPNNVTAMLPDNHHHNENEKGNRSVSLATNNAISQQQQQQQQQALHIVRNPSNSDNRPSSENSVTTGKCRKGISGEQHNTSPTLENGVRLSNDVRFGAMRAPPEPLKMMLIFEREDAQSDAWVWACRKLASRNGGCIGTDMSHSNSRSSHSSGGSSSINSSDVNHQHLLVRNLQPELVQRKIAELEPNLIVIDRRSASRTRDVDALCRWIRTQPGGNYPIILAVVKRNLLEREESPVSSILQIGYDRCYPESGSLGSCLSELLMLENSELQSRQRLRLAEASMTVAAVTRVVTPFSVELVTVTDGHFNIRYINPGVERLLGFAADEIVGKNMIELYRCDAGNNRYDINDAAQHVLTNKTREWEGSCFVRRRTGDSVPLYTRMIAVHSSKAENETPDYVLLLQEPPPLFIDKSLSGDMGAYDFYPMPRSSLHSVRKASYDVRSVGSDGAIIRRQSLARLHSMAIEGPITKVINIITAAQESSPNYISQALDKVLDILRSTELFAPHVAEVKGRNEDPVTTDLVGALLLGQKQPGYIRRSSNETSLKSSHSQLYSRPLLPSLNNISIPIQLREMLENDSQWDFDVIRLEKLTGKRPLVWLGMTIMTRFEVPRTLNCDEATLQNWLTVIEANYHSSNTYHNSTHAADVLQSTAYFLQRNRIKALLDPLDLTACLIAAAIHDVDHPGKTSGFLCNSGSELAILYNDLSVLESHHAALAFKLTCADDRVNIFKGLDRENYKVIRQSIIDMVLATEMTKHFEHLTKFINIFAKPFLRQDEEQYEPPEIDYTSLNTQENIILVKRMLIKCADVSNPTRPLNMCIEWARRIAEEYFNQTAEEKAKGLPVVMPQFDRQTCSIPKSQIGFTDYFVSDMFDAWDAYAEVPELLQHMKRNYQFWKEQEIMGVTGLPPEHIIPLTPTELVRKIEFEALAECKETVEPAEDK